MSNTTIAAAFDGLTTSDSTWPWPFFVWTLVFGVVVILFITASGNLLGFVAARLINRFVLNPDAGEWAAGQSECNNNRGAHLTHSLVLAGATAIKIGSLQFTPLGGRVFFRNVRYVSKNASVRIYDGVGVQQPISRPEVIATC